VVQQNPPLYIELSKFSVRQIPPLFLFWIICVTIKSAEDIKVLNKYVKPDFDLKANKGYITLTTHNAKADTMNSQALHDLKGN
jgi:hypothetical protein